MAKITFLGAAREVTGSCHLVESAALGRFILDCGMHQGGDATERIADDNFQFDPAGLDGVILSHAHLDHSGLLPKLVHLGFRGPIYCTAATLDLLRVLLNDALGLYVRDLERDNLRRERRGEDPLPPEYDRDDVDEVFRLCRTSRYHRPVNITSNATLTFFDAGHILGSAIVQLDLQEQGQAKRLVFSGDLGKKNSVLMKDPELLDQADVVLMESTYGNREHRDDEQTVEQLADLLRETWQQGGNVLIPSFAVGRAQELIYYLGLLHQQGLLDDWRVFLDSPMAIEVTQVYDNWLHILDRDDVRTLNESQRASLETFLPSLELCVSSEESMAINKVTHGAIVIAGSGMCTGGRIRHHFKHRIWKKQTTVLFVGFQARGTLGRLLVDGLKKIRLFGEEYVVNARIETLGGFSAHAGQTGLVSWLTHFKKPGQCVLVHGEEEAMQTLADKLGREHGIDCLLPEPGSHLKF